LLGKMPWLEDRPVSFACTGFLAPNCTLFGRIDCVRFMVGWPDGPGRSRTIIYQLFPEAFFDRPGFARRCHAARHGLARVPTGAHVDAGEAPPSLPERLPRPRARGRAGGARDAALAGALLLIRDLTATV
jgi:hypothetical protein